LFAVNSWLLREQASNLHPINSGKSLRDTPLSVLLRCAFFYAIAKNLWFARSPVSSRATLASFYHHSAFNSDSKQQKKRTEMTRKGGEKPTTLNCKRDKRLHAAQLLAVCG
jgi:hypothetical protein